METLPETVEAPPTLTLGEESVLPQVKDYLAKVKAYVLSLHDRKVDALQVLNTHSDLMDVLLRELFRRAENGFGKSGYKRKGGCSLVAQGGYGRRELCLASDIDLLILYEGKPDEFVKSLGTEVIQTLWDAGLEVGVATRTVKDCLKFMEEDLTVMTSLFDARLLAGTESLTEDLSHGIQKHFKSEKNRKAFYEKKLRENAERKRKYGGSIFLLEPNLKESEGGLRDYHTLYWVARVEYGMKNASFLAPASITPPVMSHIAMMQDSGFLSVGEFIQLMEAVRFLWRSRNQLHRLHGKKFDQLTVESQEAVAKSLGYESGDFLAVEQFMRDYYEHAAVIRQLTEKVFRRVQKVDATLFSKTRPSVLDDPNLKIIDDQLTVAFQNLFFDQPVYLMKIFEVAHRLNLKIDDKTQDYIEQAVDMIGDALIESQETHALFKKILSQPVGLSRILFSMNDLGVLSAYLPEWKNLRFRVQHNLYHVYTVDVHSIFAVQEWGRIVEGVYEINKPTLHSLGVEVARRDLLSFAILYHDIGKGVGKGHVLKGAPLIRQAGERLGYTPEEVDLLEFLELSHLIMTHIGFRRDLEDSNLIVQFAKTMDTVERLNMLYILTHCDVRGTSQEAMTSWKSSLLEHLYSRTRSVLEKGSFDTEKATQVIPKILEQTLPLIGGEQKEQKQGRCREFFAMMPPRYLLSTPPATIINHLKLWERFSHDPIVFEVKTLEREGVNEATLFTVETASLFPRMAGLFAAHNLNIVEAQLHLSSHGHALQIFRVTNHEGRPLLVEDGERWERLERDLREVLQGRLSVDGLVAEKFKPSLFKKKVAQKLPTRIDVDNDVSAYYTVIDIYTQDRVGLLYQITSTLASLGLYVDVSKISTKIDQVADTFYVKDIFGHKIVSETRLKKIKDILQQVLETEPSPGWRPPL